MSDKAVEKPVCAECGAEALGQALFCYHCGSRLTVDLQQESEKSGLGAAAQGEVLTPIDPPSGDPFTVSDGSADKKKGKPSKESRIAQKEKPNAVSESVQSRDSAESTVRTASAIRKDLGVMKLRRIETRWVPEEGGPNLWFLIGAAVLSLIVFGVFMISMYLR